MKVEKRIMLRGLIFLLLGQFVFMYSFAADRKKSKDLKPQSKYEKLFANKNCETVSSGLMTLHKIEGKLYVELPLRLLGKDMLLVSTVAETSEPMAGVPGYSSDGICFRFVLQDSMIQMCLLEDIVTTDRTTPRMEKLFMTNFGSPIWTGFEVLAYNPDSTAVVFDMTEIFQTDIPELYPLVEKSGIYDIKGKFKSKMARLDEIKAFERNVTITSYVNYDVDATYWFFILFAQKNVELKVVCSLILLPEDVMPGRIADERIGVKTTRKMRLLEEQGTMEAYAVAHRWRLEPEDVDAFERGESSEPLKPITIYVDDNFPENWKEPIRQGILEWNQAFERVGFLNAIQVRDFPHDDPAFDPNNVTYTCVRYVAHTNTAPETTLKVDPRSGEILNAAICLFHGMRQQAFVYRFLQTAVVDSRIRQKDLPDELWAECLKQCVSHEMGHVLGLENNMCASFAYPVDSLRSVSFTQRYGLSSSIMDEIKFNYVAQPGDDGVRLTSKLGPYDEYAVRWLYAPLCGVDSSREKEKVLASWLDEKVNDPVYRYGWRPERYLYDPSRLEGDLGNDAIKAGNYAMRNLKETLLHLDEWVPDDADGSVRKAIYKEAGFYFETLLTNAIKNVGGAYIYVPHEKTGVPSYRVVDKETQKRSLLWVLEQLREGEWLGQPELVTLNDFVTPAVWRVFRRFASEPFLREEYVCLFENLDSASYSLHDYAIDLYQGVWKNAIENRPLTELDKYMQRQWMESSEYRIRVMGGNALSKSLALTMLADEVILDDSFGLRPMNSLLFGEYTREPSTSKLNNINDSHMYFFVVMQECRTMLKQRIQDCVEADRPHYQAMLYCLESLLKEKK